MSPASPSPPSGGASSVTADLALVARIGAVPAILQILLDTTGLGFATIARVTETSWTACAVLDRIGFGLQPGGELEVASTLCNQIRGTREPLVIERASLDSAYCGHPAPKQYGFESYVAVPIIRRDGSFFGTICALDPKPAALRETRILSSLTLFAELVATQIELEERLTTSHTALVDATELGKLREQFIAVLGHDLRNPIASVAAGLDLLARRPKLAEPGSPILEQMRRSCRRMSGLVDDILDFARGRLGGGIPTERREVADLDQALMQVVEELRSAHPGREVTTEIALEAPVFCDPRRIAQLVSNLLGNALTHGARDWPVRVTASSDAGGFLLAVANRGAPIPQSVMAQLFQPFSRGEPGTQASGLGLGLYIAAEIARAHGGTLRVASSAAEGTVFTLTLPPDPAAA